MPETERSFEIEAQMRADWNARAAEDAHYYVAFGRRDQDDEEFFATGAEVVAGLDHELKRGLAARPAARRALEIGCGPGRLLKPMSARFGEIHGVDVSDAMIERARRNLTDIPHAHAHVGRGSDLAQFAGESFDFVYSYAVFQHIPSRDVVFSYLREACRVMKPGALARLQLNGLPKTAKEYTTWEGVRVSADEVRAFAREMGIQLLALEGIGTQYMWTTWRKARPEALSDSVRIRRITNAFSSEPCAPPRGRFASVALWLEGVPESADLNMLDLRMGGLPATLTYLGRAEADGMRQLNALLPPGLATGLVPVELAGAKTHLRVVPVPPAVPRVLSVSDGINLMAGAPIDSGTVKLQVEEFDFPETFSATICGQFVTRVETFCTDPMPPRHEVNFRLPDRLEPGRHTIELTLGTRRLSPVNIEIGEQF